MFYKHIVAAVVHAETDLRFNARSSHGKNQSHRIRRPSILDYVLCNNLGYTHCTVTCDCRTLQFNTVQILNFTIFQRKLGLLLWHPLIVYVHIELNLVFKPMIFQNVFFASQSKKNESEKYTESVISISFETFPLNEKHLTNKSFSSSFSFFVTVVKKILLWKKN